MSPLDTSRLRHEAVRIARANIGFGEHNSQFLSAIGAKPNDEWCAIFVGYCYRRAAWNLNFPRPAWTMRRRLPEAGAKRLTKNCGTVGSIWKPYERKLSHPLVGDLVCWSRGVLGWTGHVGIISEVRDGDFLTVEGNVNRMVLERRHYYSEPKLWRFASVDP